MSERGIRVILSMSLVRLAPALYDCSARYDNIKSKYRHERGFRAASGEVGTGMLFGHAGRIRHDETVVRQEEAASFEKGESTGRIRGFDPRVSPNQPTDYGGLTGEVPVSQR